MDSIDDTFELRPASRPPFAELADLAPAASTPSQPSEKALHNSAPLRCSHYFGFALPTTFVALLRGPHASSHTSSPLALGRTPLPCLNASRDRACRSRCAGGPGELDVFVGPVSQPVAWLEMGFASGGCNDEDDPIATS